MIYTLEDRAPRFLGPDYFIADSAVVIGSVTLHPNASIWFNCVVRGDTDELIIGENTNIQDGSVLHTDPGIKLRVGRDVTVGHMVMLHGCKIGRGSLIGIGSIILNGAVIGEESLIGANTLIPEGKEIPPRSVVMGSPGKIVRQVTEADLLRMQAGAAFYRKNWRRFSAGFSPQI